MSIKALASKREKGSFPQFPRTTSLHDDASIRRSGAPAPHTVGGVTVEILPSAVVDRRGARIGVTGGDLHVAKRDSRVEGGPLANRVHPAMCGSPVQSLAITAAKDRPVAALTDGEVDGPSHSGNERNECRLVALADDPQGAVATLEPKVLDVGTARFVDSKPVHAEQHGERCVVAVILLGAEQEHAELGAIQAAGVGWVDLRTPDILRRVGRHPPIDVGEAVEAQTVESRRSIVDAASPRSSDELRYSSM